jgi:hypothetical protein
MSFSSAARLTPSPQPHFLFVLKKANHHFRRGRHK